MLFSDGGQFNWDVIASAVPSKDINQVFSNLSFVFSLKGIENFFRVFI